MMASSKNLIVKESRLGRGRSTDKMMVGGWWKENTQIREAGTSF